MRDLSVDLFGLRLPSPLFMAPIGVLGICAQDGHGDLATAKASAITGVPMIASTLSNDPLEAVAREIGGRYRALPALYANRPRTRRKPRASRRGGRVQGDRRHARHLDPGLAAARSERR
jgi:isopentenyl diphosphate isomerase/L-lactate dehydrogenase-like FMN-dependent dehydrogenase